MLITPLALYFKNSFDMHNDIKLLFKREDGLQYPNILKFFHSCCSQVKDHLKAVFTVKPLQRWSAIFFAKISLKQLTGVSVK